MLTGIDHQREVVAACCEQASGHGVHVGMTLAHARALLRGRSVIRERFDPAGDERGLHRLAAWAVRFTPVVAVDQPDGLVLDVTGCERLYGGEERLVDRVQRAFGEMGIAAWIGCASTVGCAWGVARFWGKSPVIVKAGREREAMSRLAIGALRLDEKTVAGLHEVGVERVEDLLAIPRDQLIARFGMHVLERIDQALGSQQELVNAIAHEEPLIAERVFDGPVVDLEAMFITVRELLHEVAGALAGNEAGATELALTLDRVDASPIQIGIRLSRASRDERHLWSLLRPRVEGVHLGHGVECVTLHVRSSRRVVHEQYCARSSQWRDVSPAEGNLDREAGQLIDTLVHRLGPQRTLKMQMRQSHQPQRVACYVSLYDGAGGLAGGGGGRGSGLFGQGHAVGAGVAGHQPDRPSQLLPRPELIDVIAVAPEGAPMWMRWRGQEHRIISTVGPERIVAEWWASGDGDATGDGGARDYFKVQIEDGRWLWIFRQLERNGWFMHGAWT